MTCAPDDRSDVDLAADLAVDAGRLLLAVREEVGHDFPWDLGDAGDARANAHILARLRAERPDDAVLSEEAPDDLARLSADRVWIVDPVDGTREYSLPGRRDWAVHIALWQRVGGPDGTITDAAVSLPAYDEVYRSDTVTAPAATYADSQQTADFGGLQSAVTVRLAQLSSVVGAGYTTTTTI